jgi:DnaJ-class molecular chaperone
MKIEKKRERKLKMIRRQITIITSKMDEEQCKVCKGSGKQLVNGTISIECIWCEGSGTMNKEKLAEHEFYQNCWCSQECEDSAAVFHDDRVTPWEWCVLKHHWHCGVCKKIVQIG